MGGSTGSPCAAGTASSSTIRAWTDGECEDCDCGFDWQPVCSADGKQFDNPCLAKCHGADSWTEGECKDCDCGFDWQPVCSGDGEQFDNPCLAKCHGADSWTEGECKICDCG